MAVQDDDTFSNLDGSPDNVDDDDGSAKAGKQNDNGGEVDEGFEDLLSASESIEVEPMGDEPAETDDAQAQKQENAQAGEEEDDPDDDSKIPDRIKRRILRERRVAEWEAEQRVRGEVEQEITSLRQRAEEAETRAQRAQQSGSSGNAGNAEPAELTQIRERLNAAKAKRRQAKIEGDVDAEESADDEVRKLDRELWVAEQVLAQRARQQQQQQPQSGDPNAQRQQSAQRQGATAPRLSDTAASNVRAWSERNNTWYGKPGYEQATLKAKEIDQELWSKGYRPEDADYFTELDRRLKKAGIRKPGDMASNAGAGSNVAPANGGADGARGTNHQRNSREGASQVRLSAADVQLMRQLKLDPNNKAHVREWLRNG